MLLSYECGAVQEEHHPGCGVDFRIKGGSKAGMAWYIYYLQLLASALHEQSGPLIRDCIYTVVAWWRGRAAPPS
jgi:hypothetical protein